MVRIVSIGAPVQVTAIRHGTPDLNRDEAKANYIVFAIKIPDTT
jgi:hypothetical protein